MVVVAIIGILAAIAIPNYFKFRQKGYEDMVVNDVRNAASLEEAYYASTGPYLPFGPATGPNVVTLSGNIKLRVSRNVTIEGVVNPDGSLTITGTHPGATSPISYSSTIGGVLH
ncbi:hypothetical protein D6833_11380 [Candidatus Parcubacteria bacterium]|nr:MAG: hypothetical protein D6833_11380 [Candidatus Parcubacteria bacterium]